jgi:uncharacterized protein
MVKQTVLITGGSYGIGFELARVFAASGFDLILVARDEKKLLLAKKTLESNFPAITTSVVSMDLSHPKSAKALFDFTSKRKIRIDVLVNNAGFGIYGNFAQSDIEKQKEMVSLNVMTLMELTYFYLPEMIKRKDGKILNLGSIAGVTPVPTMAVYGATKAFVISFTRALNSELRGTGVSATALCPGGTATNFHKRAGIDVTKVKQSRMDPKVVALEGYSGLMNRKSVVFPGIGNKIMAKLIAIAPHDFLTSTVGKMQKMRD